MSGRVIAGGFTEVFCEVARRQFERGDKEAILRAVFLCAEARIPLPDWCRDAVMRGWTETKTEGELFHPHRPLHRSWDGVFGRPHAKHRKLFAKLQEEKLRWRIEDAVHNERAKNKKAGSPRKDPFPAVAKRYRIDKSVCKKIYYKAVEAKKKPPGKVLARIWVTPAGVVTDFEDK
jgi:hypothetical protein